MKSDFLIAVTQLAAERGLPKEKVVAAVEAALGSAFKRDSYAAGHNITVRLNPNNGDIQVFSVKTVVEDVTDARVEMPLSEARDRLSTAELGDTVESEAFFPAASGRIAAQTARQVVFQRLREAERELVLSEYVDRVGEVLAARIERVEPHQVLINLGRAEAVMPQVEQVPNERYRSNQTLQFYLVEVADTARGPELIVSRAHSGLVSGLFEREVPEIFNGVVEIRALAREPGGRSKVAVASKQEGVDPVGSCVGLRGLRIQNIVNELQGERVDVVSWDDDPAKFLANALGIAQVVGMTFNDELKTATVVVPERQLSLAIGREGQNVRLAAKLTGWKIDIKGAAEPEAKESPDIENIQPEIEIAAADVSEQPSEFSDVTVLAVEEPTGDDVQLTPVMVPQPSDMEAGVVEALAANGQEDILIPGLIPSAEEELLAQETIEPDSPSQESGGVSVDDPAIWAIPAINKGPAVLRFKEDIMAANVNESVVGRQGPDRPRSRGKRSRR